MMDLDIAGNLGDTPFHVKDAKNYKPSTPKEHKVPKVYNANTYTLLPINKTPYRLLYVIEKKT